MAFCLPFSVTSRCVKRSPVDGCVVVQDDTTASQTTDGQVVQERATSSPNAKSSLLPGTDGRKESGWISRKDAGGTAAAAVSSNKESTDKSSDSRERTTPRQGYMHLPRDRKAHFSVQDLPHPSTLRKSGASRRGRDKLRFKEELVERHMQQLKKKLATITPRGHSTFVQNSQNPDLPAEEYKDRDLIPPPPPPPLPSPEKPEVDLAVPVPATQVPVNEEDDDYWLKEHWKSQQKTFTIQPHEEE